MIETLVTNIRLFLLIFFRIIALVELAPLISSSSIPQLAKIGMTFFVSAAVFPSVLAVHPAIPPGALDYGLLVLGEVGIGLLLGFLLNLIFAAFQLAGQLFSLQMGFSASEVFDPLSQVEIPLMGEFLNLIAMLVFITTTGMTKFLLVGVQKSFQYLTAMDLVTHREGIITLLINGLVGMFQSALTIAFPILGTLLLVSVALGLLARAAPQMDILTMGFPVSIGVSFLLLFATMPFLMTAMERIIDGSFQSLSGFITTAGESEAMTELLRVLLSPWLMPSPHARRAGEAVFASVFDVHLQWFAAEDEGRTEEPSEHKLRKAREEGKVARSADVSASLVLLAGISALGLLAGYMLRTSSQMFLYFLSLASSPQALNGGLLLAFMGWLTRIVLPVLAIVFVVAILGNVIQVGLFFTAKPITPDLTRIVPRFGRWLQRSFASGEALFNFAKAMAKIAVISVIAWLNITAELDHLARLALSGFFSGVSLISHLAFRIVLESAIAFLVFAGADYWFQRRQHVESLKMSRQEVKEERKMYEGDPLTRSRLRERMRDIMRRAMLKAVPKADVVITNPTHYAVALEYNRALMIAPTVVAKGADLVAQKIKEVATANGVPLMENKPLAQALFREVEIGDTIPEKFYEAMSIILAEVYKLSGRAPQPGGQPSGVEAAG